MSAWLFAISEAFRSLWRHRFVTFLSVLTIAAALFVLGLFATVAINLRGVLLAMQEKLVVEIFLADDTTKSDVVDMLHELSSTEGVLDVEFVTKADAMRRFSAMFGREFLVGLEENPFPPSVVVRLKPGVGLAELAKKIGERYRSFPHVVEVAVPSEVAAKLSKALRIFTILTVVWGLILLFGGVVVVTNTIKLAIYGRRASIEIMRLVGATDAFIKRPFSVEGFVEGSLAGVVAALALWGLVAATGRLSPTVQMPPRALMYGIALLGMLFGTIGSRAAVKKFL